MEERLSLQISQLSDRLDTRVAEVEVGLARQLSEGLDKVTNAVLLELPRWVTNITGSVQAKLDRHATTVANAVGEIVGNKMAEVVDDSDTVRAQRKKMSRVLDDCVAAKDNLISSISSAISTVRDESVRTVQSLLREAVSSGLNIEIDPTQIKELTDELVTALQEAFKASIPDLVLAIKKNVSLELAAGLTPEIQNTARSVQSLILHDVRGAIDGETKKLLEDMARRVIDKAARQADESTTNFFENRVHSFVDKIMDSVRLALETRSPPHSM